MFERDSGDIHIAKFDVASDDPDAISLIIKSINGEWQFFPHAGAYSVIFSPSNHDAHPILLDTTHDGVVDKGILSDGSTFDLPIVQGDE